MVRSSITIPRIPAISSGKSTMLKTPQFCFLLIRAAPAAAAGKIRRTRKLLRVVTERLLNQRTLLEAFKTLRGANVSHTDMSTKTPAKNANRIRSSLSMINMFISGPSAFSEDV
jgi:hypothetical protein